MQLWEGYKAIQQFKKGNGMVSLSQNSSGKQEGGADGKEKIEAR